MGLAVKQFFDCRSVHTFSMPVPVKDVGQIMQLETCVSPIPRAGDGIDKCVPHKGECIVLYYQILGLRDFMIDPNSAPERQIPQSI